MGEDLAQPLIGVFPLALIALHQIEGLLQQQTGLQAVAGRQAPGADAEQGIAAAHSRQNDRGMVGGEGEVVILLQVVVHEAGEVARQQGLGAGDGQGSQVGEGLAVGQHPLHLGEAGSDPGQQLLCLGGEPYLAPVRLDQLLAEALLQLGDALAHRRLADIEPAGHLGHGAFAGQQAECLQPFQ